MSNLIHCPRQVATCLVPSRVAHTIGCTPLLPLKNDTGCAILAKAEHLNPGGSVKDRIASFIVSEAERRGELKPGGTILEVTSGNTGIALAMVGAIKGYRVVIMMPSTVSKERRGMIRAFGAEVRLLEELLDMQAAVAEAVDIARQDESVFLPSQFANPDNPRCHEQTTGPEILRQLWGKLDAFVMGVGTGGTLMGVGRALRKAGCQAQVVAVEPAESAVMSGGTPRGHGIQGLADGFIPTIVRLEEIDRIVTVSTEAARERARRLAAEEGLLVGISSGANVVAAEEVARRLGPGHTVVTVLCDRGERYLSVA